MYDSYFQRSGVIFDPARVAIYGQRAAAVFVRMAEVWSASFGSTLPSARRSTQLTPAANERGLQGSDPMACGHWLGLAGVPELALVRRAARQVRQTSRCEGIFKPPLPPPCRFHK